MRLKALLSIAVAAGALVALSPPALAESARLKSDTPLYMSSTGHPTQFDTAEEGMIVEVLERHGKRSLILMPDGRKAWVRTMQLDDDYLYPENESAAGLFDAPDDRVDGGVAFTQSASLVDGFSSEPGTSSGGNGGTFNQNITIVRGFSH
jgi:hypothetical protein